jgi:glutamate--cysteine ligase catalytic subunit
MEHYRVLISDCDAGERLTVTSNGDAAPAPIFHPEFGRFMLEATPRKPWGIGFKDLLDVEPNMKLR